MKKILFAIIIMAISTMAFGSTFMFDITSNAAGTADVKLFFGGVQVGSGSTTFNEPGTETVSITLTGQYWYCDQAKINGQSINTRPIYHDYITIDYPVDSPETNYCDIDIDGIENPDPGEGEDPID
jgi:hypothetical protein